MKMPQPIISFRILLSASLFVLLAFAGLAHAQVPVTPEQEAHSKLTPYQIARDKALVMCREQLLEQNVPLQQNQDALTACVRAAGVVEPPPVTATTPNATP